MERQILMIDDVRGLMPWLDQLVTVYIQYYSTPVWGRSSDEAEVKDFFREVCGLPAGVVFVSFVGEKVEAVLVSYPAKHHAEIEKKYSHAKTGIAMLFELAIADWQDIEPTVKTLVSELKKYAGKQMFSYLICEEIIGTQTSFVLSADEFSTYKQNAASPLMMETSFEW